MYQSGINLQNYQLRKRCICILCDQNFKLQNQACLSPTQEDNHNLKLRDSMIIWVTRTDLQITQIPCLQTKIHQNAKHHDALFTQEFPNGNLSRKTPKAHQLCPKYLGIWFMCLSFNPIHTKPYMLHRHSVPFNCIFHILQEVSDDYFT